MSVAIFVAVTAAGLGLGVATADGEVATPMTGMLVLGLYAVALARLGHAVGGLVGTRFAVPFVVVFVIVTWFVQLLGPLLGLPEPVRQLALTSHYGQRWGPGASSGATCAVDGSAAGATAAPAPDAASRTAAARPPMTGRQGRPNTISG